MSVTHSDPRRGMAESPRWTSTQVLQGRWESVALGFPLVMFFIFLWLDWGGEFSQSPESILWARFVTDAVFLGTIHSVLSLTLLYYLPEYREWIQSVTGGQSWRYVLQLLGVGFCLFNLFFYMLERNIHTPLILLSVYTVFDFIYGLRHWVRQTQGFSLAYNHRLKARGHVGSGDEFEKVERRERKLYTFVTYTSVLAGIFGGSQLVGALGISHPVFFGISFIACATGAVALVYLALRTPGGEESPKFLYSLRVLLVPFHFISLSANLAMRATHGFEFLLFTRQLVERSKLRRSRRWNFLFASIVLVAIAGVCTAAKGAIWGPIAARNWPEYSLWIAILAAFNGMFTYLHYYTDYFMFRMRDPKTREQVGPLLAPHQDRESPR